MVELKKHRSHAPVRPDPKPIFSYSKALRFLSTLSDFERLRIVRYNSENFNLERMRTLLKKLGNPQDHFRSVHVAGTKGKGSTCAMIAAMLQANGYKVGLYTSPHLVDVRERIVINGEMIPQASFARLGSADRAVGRADQADADLFRCADRHRVQIFCRQQGRHRRRRNRPRWPARQHQRHSSRSHRHHQHQPRPHGPARAHTLAHIATEKAGIFKHGHPRRQRRSGSAWPKPR